MTLGYMRKIISYFPNFRVCVCVCVRVCVCVVPFNATILYIYFRYIFLLNTLSGGKSCSVAPGVAVPP